MAETKNIDEVFSRLESEVKKHDVHTGDSTILSNIPSSSENNTLSKFLKLPNILFLLIPVLVFLGLFLGKPNFVMIEDPKTKVKKINFKKLMITFVVVAVGLEGAVYYFYYGKNKQK